MTDKRSNSQKSFPQQFHIFVMFGQQKEIWFHSFFCCGECLHVDRFSIEARFYPFEKQHERETCFVSSIHFSFINFCSCSWTTREEISWTTFARKKFKTLPLFLSLNFAPVHPTWTCNTGLENKIFSNLG